MPVTSSAIVEDRAQRDGRRAITERHRTDTGRVLDVSYLAEANADVAARMNARVADIDAELAREATQQMFAANLESAMRKLARFLRNSTDLEIQTRLQMTSDELRALRDWLRDQL